ncbi:MAG: hypothetical protein RIQ90_2069 [Bacteroidota bacterium]
MSLIPFSGPWTRSEAAHLLRRTMFGPTHQQITAVTNMTMTDAVNQLLSIGTVNPPLAYDAGETVVAQGQTWVSSLYPANPVSNQLCEMARVKSLTAWLMHNMNYQGLDISQRMFFFWHNHFGVSFSSDARETYTFMELLRTNSLGNVKQLVKDVTLNPAMLLFLNGNTNSVQHPNENYARELLELFTIGKGDQIAAGDYSNYTELDVASGAKILSGYVVQGIRSSTLTSAQTLFLNPLHDTSTKTLSYHFGNATVANAGAQEYANYIDIIFQQPQVAQYICMKLYRFFVNYDITNDVETNVIPELAQTLITNNYEILPVLQELFTSQHFYDVAYRGSIIRSPLETVFSMLNSTETYINQDLVTDANVYLSIYYAASNMGMDYINPTSVAGWEAYYLSPAYSRLWINSTTIKFRFDLATGLFIYGIPINGYTLKVDTIPFLNHLSLPSSAIQVIDDICELFIAKPVDATTHADLVNLLTNNLPTFEWTLQYNEYLNDPTNPTFVDPVRYRVQLVLDRIFKLPQYQMI